ncbi:repressor LexA [Microcoleus sp. FACHB-53]|nr:repressor LexA [Microcoleus sp. FACHB-53]
MSSCVRGDLEGATVQFRKLQEQENQVEIAGVSLDIPSEPRNVFSKKTLKEQTSSVYRPPGREPLTEAQQQLYNWLVEYIRISQQAPSIRQMMRAMNLRTPAPIQSRLEQLRAKGYIDWTEGKARTIEILGDSTGGVPILGVVSNGLVESFTNVAEYLDLSSLFHKPGNFALRVTGDSMKEYLIAEGDVVIMRPAPDPNQLKNALIVAARLEGRGTTIRRFYRTDDRVKLEPANSKYTPIEVSISQVQILGVLVGVWREKHN